MHLEHVAANPENAVALKPWKGEPGDKGLIELIPFLECEAEPYNTAKFWGWRCRKQLVTRLLCASFHLQSIYASRLYLL
jgi:hypothetical protein